MMGPGIYYLRPQQEEIEKFGSVLVWEERNFKYNGLEEAGALLETALEFRFQPRVKTGLRAQFYYTISTGAAESVTLYPYMKVIF